MKGKKKKKTGKGGNERKKGIKDSKEDALPHPQASFLENPLDFLQEPDENEGDVGFSIHPLPEGSTGAGNGL